MEWYIANEARRSGIAIIISYPTSASGIIVLLKTPTKYRELFSTLFVKTTDFQLEQTRTVNIFGEHGIMARPTRALQLHYSMIQFFFHYQNNYYYHHGLQKTWVSTM